MAKFLRYPGYQILSVMMTRHIRYISLEPVKKEIRCPICKSTTITNYGRRGKTIKDIPRNHKSVQLNIQINRLACSLCNVTFTQKLPLLDSSRAMTSRLVQWIQKEALVRSAYSIAFDVGIVEGTVRAVLRKNKLPHRDVKKYSASQKEIWKMPTSESVRAETTEVVFLDDDAFSALPKHFTRTHWQNDL